MRVLTFLASFYLFLGASSGILLSWMLHTMPEPWLLDSNHNHLILHLLPETDVASLFHKIQEIHPPLYNLILLGYKIISLTLLLASLLVFCIIFLAPRNRALNLVLHLLVGAWLWIFGWRTGWLFQVPRPGHTPGWTAGAPHDATSSTGMIDGINYTSVHATLYWFLIVANFIGTASYIAHLYRTQGKCGGAFDEESTDPKKGQKNE